jgi:demethoxyubiquinone hydroxylase (CLK1/Coq7/Cat5 family)
MDAWETVLSTFSFDKLLSTLGLGVLAFLFAKDMILTKAQHLRRVEDLVAHHTRELVERDKHEAELRETIAEYREAERLQRERADKAVAGMSDQADTLNQVLHVLESLDRALPRPVGGEHERV